MFFPLQIYSCDTGKKRRPLKHGSLYGLPVTAVKFIPYKDDRLLTAGTDCTKIGTDPKGSPQMVMQQSENNLPYYT